MADPSFADQIASLNSILRAIEARLALGRPPIEGLEEFRIVLDDMRLRLWGLLSVAGADDYQTFQERFRVRRATELCRRLSGDLRGGSLSGRHPELAGLKEATTELKQSIERALADGG